MPVQVCLFTCHSNSHILVAVLFYVFGSHLLLGGFLFETIRISKARFVVMPEKHFSLISILAIALKQIYL